MAIFDGIGDLIPAPDDKGVYNNKENDIPIVPLPKSIVLPKERYEDPILPDDQENAINEGNEIEDQGELFPEGNNSLVPVKENILLPIGVDLSAEVEEILFPKGVIIPEIIDDVITPESEPILVIDESSLQDTPKGVILQPVIEDEPTLPLVIDTDIPVDDIVVGAPKDATFYIENEDSSSLNTGIVLSPKGINYSDTIIDRLFTKATDIFDFIRVPVPQSLISLYSKIQEIEGFLSDPKSFAIQVRENVLGFLLGTNTEDKFDPKIGIVMIPKDPLEDIFYFSNSTSKAQIDRDNELKGISAGEMKIIEGYVNKERDKQISDDILESQFSFQGRKSTVGVTLRLNHLWDLRFEPYNDSDLGIRCVLPKMYDTISTAYENTINKASTERYREIDHIDKKGNKVYLGEAKVFDWEDTLPVLSYDLDYLSLASRDVELYGGSTISIPEIIRRNSLLTTQILDDENKRWRRWFQRALDSMCPPPINIGGGESDGGVVVPYKNCCMKATLYQYRTDSHILSHKVLLVLLKNYQVTSSGAGGGAGTPDIIDAEWSIVGEIENYSVPPQKNYISRSQRNRDFPTDQSPDEIELEESKDYASKYINIV